MSTSQPQPLTLLQVQYIENGDNIYKVLVPKDLEKTEEIESPTEDNKLLDSVIDPIICKVQAASKFKSRRSHENTEQLSFTSFSDLSMQFRSVKSLLKFPTPSVSETLKETSLKPVPTSQAEGHSQESGPSPDLTDHAEKQDRVNILTSCTSSLFSEVTEDDPIIFKETTVFSPEDFLNSATPGDSEYSKKCYLSTQDHVLNSTTVGFENFSLSSQENECFLNAPNEEQEYSETATECQNRVLDNGSKDAYEKIQSILSLWSTTTLQEHLTEDVSNRVLKESIQEVPADVSSLQKGTHEFQTEDNEVYSYAESEISVNDVTTQYSDISRTVQGKTSVWCPVSNSTINHWNLTTGKSSDSRNYETSYCYTGSSEITTSHNADTIPLIDIADDSPIKSPRSLVSPAKHSPTSKIVHMSEHNYSRLKTSTKSDQAAPPVCVLGPVWSVDKSLSSRKTSKKRGKLAVATQRKRSTGKSSPIVSSSYQISESIADTVDKYFKDTKTSKKGRVVKNSTSGKLTSRKKTSKRKTAVSKKVVVKKKTKRKGRKPNLEKRIVSESSDALQMCQKPNEMKDNININKNIPGKADTDMQADETSLVVADKEPKFGSENVYVSQNVLDINSETLPDKESCTSSRERDNLNLVIEPKDKNYSVSMLIAKLSERTGKVIKNNTLLEKPKTSLEVPTTLPKNPGLDKTAEGTDEMLMHSKEIMALTSNPFNVKSLNQVSSEGEVKQETENSSKQMPALMSKPLNVKNLTQVSNEGEAREKIKALWKKLGIPESLGHHTSVTKSHPPSNTPRINLFPNWNIPCANVGNENDSNEIVEIGKQERNPKCSEKTELSTERKVKIESHVSKVSSIADSCNSKLITNHFPSDMVKDSEKDPKESVMKGIREEPDKKVEVRDIPIHRHRKESSFVDNNITLARCSDSELKHQTKNSPTPVDSVQPNVFSLTNPSTSNIRTSNRLLDSESSVIELVINQAHNQPVRQQIKLQNLKCSQKGNLKEAAIEDNLEPQPVSDSENCVIEHETNQPVRQQIKLQKPKRPRKRRANLKPSSIENNLEPPLVFQSSSAKKTYSSNPKLHTCLTNNQPSVNIDNVRRLPGNDVGSKEQVTNKNLGNQRNVENPKLPGKADIIEISVKGLENLSCVNKDTSKAENYSSVQDPLAPNCPMRHDKVQKFPNIEKTGFNRHRNSLNANINRSSRILYSQNDSEATDKQLIKPPKTNLRETTGPTKISINRGEKEIYADKNSKQTGSNTLPNFVNDTRFVPNVGSHLSASKKTSNTKDNRSLNSPYPQSMPSSSSCSYNRSMTDGTVDCALDYRKSQLDKQDRGGSKQDLKRYASSKEKVMSNPVKVSSAVRENLSKNQTSKSISESRLMGTQNSMSGPTAYSTPLSDVDSIVDDSDVEFSVENCGENQNFFRKLTLSDSGSDLYEYLSTNADDELNSDESNLSFVASNCGSGFRSDSSSGKRYLEFDKSIYCPSEFSSGENASDSSFSSTNEIAENEVLKSIKRKMRRKKRLRNIALDNKISSVDESTDYFSSGEEIDWNQITTSSLESREILPKQRGETRCLQMQSHEKDPLRISPTSETALEEPAPSPKPARALRSNTKSLLKQTPPKEPLKSHSETTALKKKTLLPEKAKELSEPTKPAIDPYLSVIIRPCFVKLERLKASSIQSDQKVKRPAKEISKLRRKRKQDKIDKLLSVVKTFLEREHERSARKKNKRVKRSLDVIFSSLGNGNKPVASVNAKHKRRKEDNVHLPCKKFRRLEDFTRYEFPDGEVIPSSLDSSSVMNRAGTIKSQILTENTLCSSGSPKRLHPSIDVCDPNRLEVQMPQLKQPKSLQEKYFDLVRAFTKAQDHT